MNILAEMLRFEWSMGNGQCPICNGMGLAFMDRVNCSMFRTTVDDLGHKPGCWLAGAISEHGEVPMMKGPK